MTAPVHGGGKRRGSPREKSSQTVPSTDFWEDYNSENPSFIQIIWEIPKAKSLFNSQNKNHSRDSTSIPATFLRVTVARN